MGYKKSARNDYLALPYKAFLKCGVTSILTENLMKITGFDRSTTHFSVTMAFTKKKY